MKQKQGQFSKWWKMVSKTPCQTLTRYSLAEFDLRNTLKNTVYTVFISIIEFYEIKGHNHKIVWFASAALSCPKDVK